MVSKWSAECSDPLLPASCVNSVDISLANYDRYAWTDLTYLLHKAHVSWRYYVQPGLEPDCRDPDEVTRYRHPQSAVLLGYWNPLPAFATVAEDGQLGNIRALRHFFSAVREGRLPAVCWIVPGHGFSEHPPDRVSYGQAYVTRLINAVERSPQWRSSAILLSWDEWGGFYDDVRSPRDDRNGYGLRVPGLLISPYALRGYIDHQTLSHDAYVKFVEDGFFGGQRLNPATTAGPTAGPTCERTIHCSETCAASSTSPGGHGGR